MESKDETQDQSDIPIDNLVDGLDKLEQLEAEKLLAQAATGDKELGYDDNIEVTGQVQKGKERKPPTRRK